MPINSKKNRLLAENHTIDNIICWFKDMNDLELLTTDYDGNPDMLVEYKIISKNIIMKTKWISLLNGNKPWINGYDFFNSKTLQNIIKSFNDKKCKILYFFLKDAIFEENDLSNISANKIYKNYSCCYLFNNVQYKVTLHRWLYGSLPHIEKRGTRYKLSTIKEWFQNEGLEYISGYKDMHSIVTYRITENYPEVSEQTINKIFKVELSHFLYDNSRPHENGSNNEILIRKILQKFDINFEEQRTFPNLIGDNKPLRFDFYLSDFNVLVEIDGGFHFIQTKLNNLEKQQKYDKLKDEYCLKNKIPLIRISESFIKNNIDEVYEIFGTEEYLKNVFEIDRYGKEYELLRKADFI